MFNNVFPSDKQTATEAFVKTVIGCVVANALEGAKNTAVYPAQIAWSLLSSAVSTVAANTVVFAGKAVYQTTVFAGKTAVNGVLYCMPAPPAPTP